MVYLASSGVSVGLEKCARRENHARSAVTALGRAVLGEGALKGVGPTPGNQAFDRYDGSVPHLGSEQNTGENGGSTNEDRAGPALADLTAVLGPGQAQVLAEDLEQGPVIVDEKLTIDTVHGQTERPLGDQAGGPDGIELLRMKAVPTARRLAVRR